MAARLITKKSTVAGKVPVAADLDIGELAVNTADAKLYTKHSDNTIKQLGGEAASSFFSLVTVTATSADQTSFTIPGGYTPGAVVVFLEGASLAPAHYTATSGSAIVLASGTDVVVGTELVVLRLSTFAVADALPLAGTAADSSKLGGQLPEYYLGGGAWGGITGTLSAQTDLQTALNGKVAAADIDFTIIYPNGGTEVSAANVSSNSRYVMANPFPGHSVMCVAEVLYNGQWGAAGWSGAYSGSAWIARGVAAHQLGEDSVVVQTGNSAVMIHSVYSGNPHGSTDGQVSLPCRVKVWKLKGAFA
jgi:hypothetical protein